MREATKESVKMGQGKKLTLWKSTTNTQSQQTVGATQRKETKQKQRGGGDEVIGPILVPFATIFWNFNLLLRAVYHILTRGNSIDNFMLCYLNLLNLFLAQKYLQSLNQRKSRSSSKCNLIYYYFLYFYFYYLFLFFCFGHFLMQSVLLLSFSYQLSYAQNDNKCCTFFLFVSSPLFHFSPLFYRRLIGRCVNVWTMMTLCRMFCEDKKQK